ncbi:hypothetical protein MD535_05685 [Vibrio sp. ZSDZ65]|jgi:hypothetical protein|uniref:Uncharacterized protein n=1 Tax=Vibrio qingdaonensis TaxID=2829491 RepID=A0A9X3CL99_9VIBR|nr:hypothetical protein [Vibrio qingdaonensis]MCW8345509.1 hypothetical protein [Vibrio qingdaonensis]
MKKISALSLVMMSALTSQVAFADATAVLTWNGQIGANLADNDYMITGNNGSTSADVFKGAFLDIQPNATFDSEHIVLEMRANSGDATSPVAGDLWSGGTVTWTLDNVIADIDGVDLQAQAGGALPVVVSINGENVSKGASYSDTSFNRIGVKVSNQQALDPSVVAGRDIVVEVNLSATAA